MPSADDVHCVRSSTRYRQSSPRPGSLDVGRYNRIGDGVQRIEQVAHAQDDDGEVVVTVARIRLPGIRDEQAVETVARRPRCPRSGSVVRRIPGTGRPDSEVESAVVTPTDSAAVALPPLGGRRIADAKMWHNQPETGGRGTRPRDGLAWYERPL